MLRFFELESRLKINFGKSSLMYLGCNDEIVEMHATFLNCKIGVCPFNYLGLPVGGRTKERKLWTKVKDKFEKRLLGWENKFLLLGGRIVLTNAELKALPIYYLSFFKAPLCILDELVSLLRNLIMGGGLDKEK